MKFRREIPGDDFSRAGQASAEFKRLLARLGIDPSLVRRAAVAMYEGEINMAIHAGGGCAEAEVLPDRVVMVLSDEGPGIADLDLAMTEGWSTASPHFRELGFGAGMGLPNMKRNVDEMRIESEVGRGTTVRMVILLPECGGSA